MQATKFELLELNYKQLAPLLTEDPMLKKKKKATDQNKIPN